MKQFQGRFKLHFSSRNSVYESLAVCFLQNFLSNLYNDKKLKNLNGKNSSKISIQFVKKSPPGLKII